jgi:hypothetical protein
MNGNPHDITEIVLKVALNTINQPTGVIKCPLWRTVYLQSIINQIKKCHLPHGTCR